MFVENDKKENNSATLNHLHNALSVTFYVAVLNHKSLDIYIASKNIAVVVGGL